MNDLETKFLRGKTPDIADLIGWEFRGTNQPAWAKLLGIQKFMKGFYKEGDKVFGYNLPVRQNGLEHPWQPTGGRFGFYQVDAVDPTTRDNAYLHAVLLDYGRGKNPFYNPMRGLRDYLVQLDDDTLLGKAFYAVGPMRVATNFFVLERERRN